MLASTLCTITFSSIKFSIQLTNPPYIPTSSLTFNLPLQCPNFSLLTSLSLSTSQSFFLHSSASFSCSFKSSVSFVCPTPLSSCSQLTLSNSIKIFYFNACRILPKVDILYNYTTLISTLLYPLRLNWMSYLTLLTLSNC